MSDGHTNSPDPLIQRERIRGASRMIPEGMDASKVGLDRIDQVRTDLDTFVRHYKVSIAEVAGALGRSPSVISEFLKAKYAGNNEQLAKDVDEWLADEENRRSRSQTTVYTETNVALLIKSVVSYAKEKGRISLIYGPDTTGIGKTTTLRAIWQLLGPRQCTLVTMDKVDASPTGMLVKLCRAMRLNDNGTNRGRQERIKSFLRARPDLSPTKSPDQVRRSHVVLIDQIHNLRYAKDDKPLYILNDIYDATGVGQVWCGTADMVHYLQKRRAKEADESLGQIRSRIFPAINLIERVEKSEGGSPMLATTEQIREMFSKNQLKLTGTAARFLCTLANIPDEGGFRVCECLVEYATEIGMQRRATQLDIDHLREALQITFSSDRFDLLVAAMVKEQPTLKAKLA